MDIISQDGGTLAEDLPDAVIPQIGSTVVRRYRSYRVVGVEHTVEDDYAGNLTLRTTVYVEDL